MNVLYWISCEYHDTSAPSYRHMFGDIKGYYIYVAMTPDGGAFWYTDQDGNILAPGPYRAFCFR